MNNFKYGVAVIVTLFISLVGFSQCNTTNFTVTKVNGTCFSNGSITVVVPTSTDCSAWVAVISRPSDGFSNQLNIPATGGSVTFNSLPPGSYNVSLANGFQTISYSNNPIAVTTSYVNMNISVTSTAPSCQNTAAGYTPDGTLTTTVANGTGIGPFVYTLVSSNGSQTFTSALRSYTFSGVPGGEQVNISVTDQAGGSPGCSVTSSQSPTTVANTSPPMTFSDRPFNYERDCSSPTATCNNVNLFVNIKNLNAARLLIVQQPGNATITIAGNTYNLTYLSGSARFKYDPVATGGPNLVHGMPISVSFYDGCTTITKSNNIVMNNDYLVVSPTTLTNTANCTFSYLLKIFADQDIGGGSCCTDRAVYFCAQNTLTFERRISTSPDVWEIVPSNQISPDPSLSSNPLSAVLGGAIPSAASAYTVYQPGTYRVTASDACHTVQRIVTVNPVNPFTNVSASQTTSVLQGTSSIKIHFNGLPALTSPVKAKITRVDGQTSMTINPTQPLNLAGSYTINFPIERTIGYPTSFYFIQDLPLGQYIVELSDGCSSTTGYTKTITVNLTNAVSYNALFSVTPGCIGSNSISYNMNPVNASNSNIYVKLFKDNGNGALGPLVQTSTSDILSGTFTNLNSGNYFIVFDNIKTEAFYNGGNSYSAAMNNLGPWQYKVPITIQPYQDITVSTVTSFCDIGDTNSGIILAQVATGTIGYPITFQLFSVADPTTPLPGQSGTFDSPIDAVAFENISVGNYFVRVSTTCYSVDTNVTLSTSGSVPQAEVSNSVICPGSPTTIAIIASSQNLFDVTWFANGQIVGTGMPITLAPTVTTTYTAVYTLKSEYGCANSPEYTSDVTVTVTPNPNLGLSVSDINLCDGSAPSVTIYNTQSLFTYEIVNSNGTSFSPPLIANGTGGSVTIPIPNSITLVAGQTLNVKSTNGNAGCTGILSDVVHILSGTFNITCPTFPSTSVQCYADLPTQTTYSIAQFQALGNGDGIIDVVGCGVVEITATNGVNPGCNADVIRTYTITEYADPNNNDIRDAGENTVLKTTTCTQTITINDTTAPVVTGTLTASNTYGCSIAVAPSAMTTVTALEAAGLTISDNCTTDVNLVVTSSDGTATGTCPITFTRTYTITDACNNAITATQTININDSTAPVVTGTLNPAASNGCSITDASIAMTSVSQLETAGLTISDNCTTDANLVVTSVDGTATGSCPITFTRTYTITDACNNATTVTQTININDTTAPVVAGTLPAVNANGCTSADAPAALTTVAALEAAGLTISDNCTTDVNLVVTSVDGTASGTCPITFTRTYTITDACNNATTVTQTININDTTAPVVAGTLPAVNASGCTSADAPAALTTVATLEAAGLTISDNCTTDANLVVTSVDGTASGTCPITFTRTYTITDACNNATTVTQTININDTTAPVVAGTLPAVNASGCTSADAPAALTTVAALEAAGLTISDNCTTDANLVVTSVDGTASGTCPITFTRTYTITDACNNATTVTQTININDTTAPVVAGTLPAVNASGCTSADAPAALTTVAALEAVGLTISDNCTTNASLVVTSSDGTATGTCPITFTRTYTIKDACNNATTVTQTININDTTAPVVAGTLPAVNASGCTSADAPAALTTVAALEAAGLTISDNCTTDANLVVTSVDGTATGSCPITFTRTYTITDACNNATTVTQTININDTTAPVVAGTLPAVNASGCTSADAPAALTTVAALEAAGLTISDNCTTDANLVVTSVDGTATGSCPITFTRTYTITDSCNNATTVTQTININDTTAPVVAGTLPAVNASGCTSADAPAALTTVAALEATGLTISDNCTTDANLVVTSVDGTASGTCPITFTRTYTITDACNNATTVTQTININDTTAPVVAGTLPAVNASGCTSADAPAALTTVAALEATGLTISDNCTTDANLVVTSVDGTASGTCPITFTRTYTITDACNNATTVTQTININDTTAPVVAGTLPAVNASGCTSADAPAALTTVAALEAAGLTISDNCTTDANLVVTSVDGTATGSCPITFTRTYTITDSCNNATTVTQTININDTTAPVVAGTLPAVNASGCTSADAPAALTTVAALEAAGLTISDNCTTNASLVVTSSDGTATGTCPITFTRTYTIKDACNNATTVTQTININDTTAPIFSGTVPQNITLECNQTIPSAAIVTATDNCNGIVTINFTEQNQPGTCPNNYVITRTWVAIDICGNSQTHTQQITIQDTTPPVFVGSLPSNEVFAKCDGIPMAPVLTATDNCGSATVSYSEVKIDGDCTNKYRLERTWTATDSCGNESQINQTVYLACYVTPFNALSPDGDGLNDTFIIEGLECYPNNSVEIYNRWGVLVFEAAYYDNVNNVFRGFSDGRSTVSRNDKLPTGNYWYVLKYEYDLYGRTKENIEKIGYIYIQNE